MLFILALGITAHASLGKMAPQQDTPAQATPAQATMDEASDESTVPAEQQMSPAPDTLAPGAGYECPEGVPYCYKDSQCEGYCGGPGGFDLCYRGCCTCAG